MLINPGFFRSTKIIVPVLVSGLAVACTDGPNNGVKKTNAENGPVESQIFADPFGIPSQSVELDTNSVIVGVGKKDLTVKINAVNPNVTRFSFTNLNTPELKLPGSLTITTDMAYSPKFSGQFGVWVPIKELLTQKIRTADWEKIQNIASRYKTVLIVEKKYNLHFLIVDNKVINFGPIGTAHKDNYPKNIKVGTPAGIFKIHRQEGPDHTSNEFESADMGYASYFSDFCRAKGDKGGFGVGRSLDAMRGIAIHSSDPRTERDKKGGPLRFKINASHGCVNSLREDAKLIQKHLKYGSYVVVLE